MAKRKRSWGLVPYLVAAVLWMVLYQRTDMLTVLVQSGRSYPWVFIFVVGYLLSFAFEFTSDSTSE